MEKYYYWIDTDYHYGDFSVPKFAFFRGEIVDEEKDRNSEKCLFWEEYKNLDGYDECVTEYGDVDTERAWKLIDEYIKSKLGFLPDYEVN